MLAWVVPVFVGIKTSKVNPLVVKFLTVHETEFAKDPLNIGVTDIAVGVETASAANVTGMLFVEPYFMVFEGISPPNICFDFTTC